MRKTAVAVVSIFVIVCSCVCVAQVKGKQRPGAGAGVDVERAKAGTPEIASFMPEQIPNGKETDVVVRGKYFPTGERKFMADGSCKLIKGWAASDSEFHFTVISTREEGGDCYMTARGTGKNVYQIVEVSPTAAIAERRRKEAEVQRAKNEKEAAAAMDFINKAPEMVGKKWTVTLPNGKTDTWTFQEKAMMGGKFKSGSGETVTIILQPTGTVMALVGQKCSFTGTFKSDRVDDGKAEMPASICPLGPGKWTAVVSK